MTAHRILSPVAQVMQDQVATILESVRVFMTIKNIKMILLFFSDAEELGLNGAALFVTQHKWAKILA
jgi:hypothetical protein